mgnify:CR=1 FL=1
MKKAKDKEEEFPYDQFPWKLIHSEGKETTTCYFQCEDHMKKHLERYKLKKTQYKVTYKFD